MESVTKVFEGFLLRHRLTMKSHCARSDLYAPNTRYANPMPETLAPQVDPHSRTAPLNPPWPKPIVPLKWTEYGFGYIIRSPYTPYSIYFRGDYRLPKAQSLNLDP